MDVDTAIARLTRMTAADNEPVLDSDALLDLLKTAARVDPFGNSVQNVDGPDYESGIYYPAGSIAVANGTRFWRAIQGGTSVGTAFPVITANPQGVLLYDGGDLIWQDYGNQWVPTYDLNAAAAEGWRWKAAQVAGRYSFASDGQQFSRSEFIAHCFQMSSQYDHAYAYQITIGTLGD